MEADSSRGLGRSGDAEDELSSDSSPGTTGEASSGNGFLRTGGGPEPDGGRGNLEAKASMV